MVIEALQESQRPMTDGELAAATARDLASIRKSLHDLADFRIVELTQQSPDQTSGRLGAL